MVLATGSVSLPVPGTSFDGRVLDTAATWLMNEQPKRLAVVGAGASGAEIASAFGRFGTEVVLIEMLDQILPRGGRRDREGRATRAPQAEREGRDRPPRREGEGRQGRGRGHVRRRRTESFDYLCIAAGRAPDIEGLGLDELSVKTGERGLIEVDGAMRTSADGVYAIGDLVHGPALAHKASDEGIIAVEDAAGLQAHPLVIRGHSGRHLLPPAGRELRAHRGGGDGARRATSWSAKFPMGGVGAATVYGDRKGMVKIVGDRKYGELLGAHIVGARATEMIAELVVAKQLEGGYEEVARTVHPHPTFSEAVMEAARATAGWVIHA